MYVGGEHTVSSSCIPIHIGMHGCHRCTKLAVAIGMQPTRDETRKRLAGVALPQDSKCFVLFVV